MARETRAYDIRNDILIFSFFFFFEKISSLDRYFFPEEFFIRTFIFPPAAIFASNISIFFGKKIARYSSENPIFVAETFLPRDSRFFAAGPPIKVKFPLRIVLTAPVIIPRMRIYSSFHQLFLLPLLLPPPQFSNDISIPSINK